MTTATYLLTLPADAGTSGQFLTTNGSNTISWTTPATTKTVQTVSTFTGAVATGTTILPRDDTIPQNTEGDQYMTLAITPTSSTNILRIKVLFNCSANPTGIISIALFQDTTANALAAEADRANADKDDQTLFIDYIMTAGTTSATTFKVRGGPNVAATTTTFNGKDGVRNFGGVWFSSIIIDEYVP